MASRAFCSCCGIAIIAIQRMRLPLQDADGKTIDMSQYKGKVVLIINVASACGYTPQYKEMAELYDKYKGQGFVILGFPCNQACSLTAGPFSHPHCTRAICLFCKGVSLSKIQALRCLICSLVAKSRGAMRRLRNLRRRAALSFPSWQRST